MPVPGSINDLSTTAASNYPAGGESVFPNLDDYFRAHASFIAYLRDNKLDASVVSAFMLTVLNDADAPTARATLAAVGTGDAASDADAKTGTSTTKFVTPASLQAAKIIQSGTVATTSGTAHTFTGIPAFVKRVTLTLSGVSTSGSARPIVQIGSTTFDVSGYSGSYSDGTITAFSAGFICGGALASNVQTCTINLVHMGGNLWSCSLTGSFIGAGIYWAAGSKALSGVLDRVRLTTDNGTDTFDAGTLTVHYE